MIKKKNRSKRIILILSSVISLSLVTGGIILAKIILSDDSSKRKCQMHMITLVKPPPPPKIEEKPPEPEVEKKEEIKEPEPDQPQEVDNSTPDEAPPGDQLGLDSEGGIGSDGFGLVAKKGGRALIGSGSQYAWYYQRVIDELQTVVNRLIRENGGIPDRKLKTEVRIIVDDYGNIVDFEIIQSSGNQTLDATVKEAIALTAINEPPPTGMPRAMKFRISPRG